MYIKPYATPYMSLSYFHPKELSEFWNSERNFEKFIFQVKDNSITFSKLVYLFKSNKNFGFQKCFGGSVIFCDCQIWSYTMSFTSSILGVIVGSRRVPKLGQGVKLQVIITSTHIFLDFWKKLCPQLINCAGNYFCTCFCHKLHCAPPAPLGKK